MKWLLILFFSTSLFAQQTSETFIVTIKNDRIHVISPDTQISPVSVVIKNETTAKIHSEIRTSDRVIHRFVVKPLDSKSLLVDIDKAKNLFYVSVAPPFQAVELKMSQLPYEIPPEQ